MSRKRKSREQELQDWKNQQLIKEIESSEDRVGDEPAVVREGDTGRKDRIDAYYSTDVKHGHLASNDGLNANYLREPGMEHDDYVVDDLKDEPYK